jgi:hypothetical protein
MIDANVLPDWVRSNPIYSTVTGIGSMQVFEEYNVNIFQERPEKGAAWVVIIDSFKDNAA